MKIIVLVGKSNTGKTSALKKLIKKLADESGENLLDVPGANKCRSFISPCMKEKLLSVDELDGDFFVKMAYDSLNIGISTAGDTSWNIEHKFNLLKDCNYFVCASRTYGESYNYINELNKKYEVIKINKIGCIGSEFDEKYTVLREISDELTVIEILKHMEDK